MRIAASICTLLVAGCALQAPPPASEWRAQALPALILPEQYVTLQAPVPGAVAAGDWVASFNDPQLDALVQQALLYNNDLKVAEARVGVAAGYLRLSGSPLWPQVQALAHGGGKMGGDSSGLNGGGVSASWELDLWGRVRAAQAGAAATLDSATLDAQYARQSIAAQTARSWFAATAAQMQLALARDAASAAASQVTLASDRLRVGAGTESDVDAARSQEANARDLVLQRELALVQALRAVETMVGRYPAGVIAVPARLVAMPGPVPVGLPSDLLERRPDVVAAQRRIEQVFYGVQEAKAARLPRISLTASILSISSELFVLQERSNPSVSLGGTLVAPLFLGGALQSQVDIRTAEQALAVADYGRVGARAFNEVEGALSSEFTLTARVNTLARSVADNSHALQLARDRYRVGSGDLRAVNEQALTLTAARSALAAVETEQRISRVNLYLALGGGFGTPADAVAAAQPASH